MLRHDLVPVDADSWMVMTRRNRPPHGLIPQDGSVILIHGNGNEPGGPPMVADWLQAHPTHILSPMHLFVHAGSPAE